MRMLMVFDSANSAINASERLMRSKGKYESDRYIMQKDITALEEKLKPYLSFQNVRGWTIF